jgi:hypothetical protein
MAQAMRTHTGEIVTGDRLNEARKYAAGFERRSCRQWLTNPDYGADHVTTSQHGKYAARKMLEVLRIERGECDHNFTIWQRMDYFLTGESVPFLSN